jgi:hypothetical protein
MNLVEKKKKTSQKKKSNALTMISKTSGTSVSMTFQATPSEIMRAFAEKYGLTLEVGDVMIIESKPYITKSGLLRLSHIQKVKAVIPKRVHIDYDQGFAHYECTVTTSDDRVYKDEGFCAKSEGKRNMQAVIGTAITRARNRALAAATGTPNCTYDEFDDDLKRKGRDIVKIVEEED